MKSLRIIALLVVLGCFQSLNINAQGYEIIQTGGKAGLQNSEGKLLIKPEYDSLTDNSFGRLTAYKTNKVGLFDTLGNKILDLVYDAIDAKPNGFIEIKNNGLYGLVNPSGEMIMNTEYEDIAVLEDLEIVKAKKQGKYGVLHFTGRKIVDFIYENISDFESNYAIATINSRSGVIDINGATIIPCDYDLVKFLDEKITLTVLKKKFDWYMFHLPTRKMIDYKFINDGDGGSENPEIFSERIKVNKNGLFGYVDLEGKIAIPCQFTKATHFDEGGKAKVSKDGKNYFNINTNGDIVK